MAPKNNKKQIGGKLHNAIQRYKIGKIPSLVTQDLDFTTIRNFMEEHRITRTHPDSRAATPLFSAICLNRIEICKRLLAEGADINATFFCDRLPLSVALGNKNYELAILLIKSGADVNLLDSKERCTPMHHAITNDSPVFIVKEILDAGFPKDRVLLRTDSSTGKNMKCPAIIKAILENNVPVVRYLLEQCVNIKFVCFAALSPLGLAVKLKFLQVVSELIKGGAKVEGETQFDIPPLILATAHYDIEPMKTLLDSGTDINQFLKCPPNDFVLVFGDEDTKTPLHVAVNLCNIEVIELLLERGANVNAALPITKTTPLHVISAMKNYMLRFQKKGYLKTLKLLLESGANINAENWEGLTPLDATIIFDTWDAESMEIWVRNGADVNKPIDGISIFQLAICSNMPSLIDVCLSFGGDCSSKCDGESTYQMAFKFCNLSAMRIILKYGHPYNDYPSTICHDIPENPDKMRILPLISTLREFIGGVNTNNPTLVENSLKKGAVAKTTSLGVRYPLHLAASKGFLEIVQILLREGVSACSLNGSRMTPLHVAAQAGYWRVCEALLQHGASYNSSAGHHTPLQLSGSREVAGLLETVADAFRMAKQGSTQLLDNLQMFSEDEDQTRFWVLMNCVDRHFRSLMETALHHGHVVISKEILNLRLKSNQY